MSLAGIGARLRDADEEARIKQERETELNRPLGAPIQDILDSLHEDVVSGRKTAAQAAVEYHHAAGNIDLSQGEPASPQSSLRAPPQQPYQRSVDPEYVSLRGYSPPEDRYSSWRRSMDEPTQQAVQYDEISDYVKRLPQSNEPLPYSPDQPRPTLTSSKTVRGDPRSLLVGGEGGQARTPRHLWTNRDLGDFERVAPVVAATKRGLGSSGLTYDQRLGLEDKKTEGRLSVADRQGGFKEKLLKEVEAGRMTRQRAALLMRQKELDETIQSHIDALMERQWEFQNAPKNSTEWLQGQQDQATIRALIGAQAKLRSSNAEIVEAPGEQDVAAEVDRRVTEALKKSSNGSSVSSGIRKPTGVTTPPPAIRGATRKPVPAPVQPAVKSGFKAPAMTPEEAAKGW